MLAASCVLSGMKYLLISLFAVAACGGNQSASSKSAPATKASAGNAPGSAAACPASLNCQPPTNDKDPLCQLTPAELKQRCPSTQVLE